MQRLGQSRQQIVMERQPLQLLHGLPHEPRNALRVRHRHCFPHKLIPAPGILARRQVEGQEIGEDLPALHVNVPHSTDVEIPHRLDVAFHGRLQRRNGLEQAEIEQRELRRRRHPQHLPVDGLDDHPIKLSVIHRDHQHLLFALSDRLGETLNGGNHQVLQYPLIDGRHFLSPLGDRDWIHHVHQRLLLHVLRREDERRQLMRHALGQLLPHCRIRGHDARHLPLLPQLLEGLPQGRQPVLLRDGCLRRVKDRHPGKPRHVSSCHVHVAGIENNVNLRLVHLP
mmetsp:Transcript_43599/g.115106  ORF Transcript_43599/g.115106 Transcript_43599/m.115106 type:complete len:283 (-) Transcript_43599:514-1362(-)